MVFLSGKKEVNNLAQDLKIFLNKKLKDFGRSRNKMKNNEDRDMNDEDEMYFDPNDKSLTNDNNENQTFNQNRQLKFKIVTL